MSGHQVGSQPSRLSAHRPKAGGRDMWCEGGVAWRRLQTGGLITGGEINE